jgi:hypothetical protein
MDSAGPDVINTIIHLYAALRQNCSEEMVETQQQWLMFGATVIPIIELAGLSLHHDGKPVPARRRKTRESPAS